MKSVNLQIQVAVGLGQLQPGMRDFVNFRLCMEKQLSIVP
jgi:hypothetical protein